MNTTSQILCVFFNNFNVIRICYIYYYNSIFSVWSTLSTNNSNFTIWWYFNIINCSCINLNAINFFNIWRICNIPKVCSTIRTPCPSYSIISFINSFKDPEIRCMFIVNRPRTYFFYLSLNFPLEDINNFWFWCISKWCG